MTKIIMVVIAIVLCLAITTARAQTALSSSKSLSLDASAASKLILTREERIDELIPIDNFEPIYKPVVNIEEFIPYLAEQTLFPGADLNNFPEDEEVSSIPPENDIPYPISMNVASQKMVTYTLDGLIINDERQIAMDGSQKSKTSILDLKITPIDLHFDDKAIAYIDLDTQIATACFSSPCSALQTSLNTAALGNTLRQLISPILAAFNNKEIVIKNSWPHVTFTMVALTLNSVDITSTNGRINVNLIVSATGKLHVRTKLAGSATTTFNIVNYSVQAGAQVSLQNQKIQVASVSVTAGYQDLNIHTSGGLIMKFIIRVASTLLKIKTTCRNILVDNVPTALKDTLAAAATNLVNTVPWKLKTGKWGAGISLNVVKLVTTTPNVILVGFDAHTINFSTGAPFPHQSPPKHDIQLQPNPSHLFNIMVDTFVVNDYVSSWFSQQPHVNLYTRTSNPQWLTDLNTLAWSLIFPAIGDNHPNSDLIMKVELDAPPSIAVDGTVAQFTGSAIATWAIDNGMGTISEPLVTIKLDLSAGLLMSMKYDQVNQYYALVPTITNLNPVFSNIQTAIGPIDMSNVNNTLNNIINYVLVPMIDLVLLDGIPLPATANFQMVNPVITFLNNSILVGTGVNISF